jgi:hypothetical protein
LLHGGGGALELRLVLIELRLGDQTLCEEFLRAGGAVGREPQVGLGLVEAGADDVDFVRAAAGQKVGEVGLGGGDARSRAVECRLLLRGGEGDEQGAGIDMLAFGDPDGCDDAAARRRGIDVVGLDIAVIVRGRRDR